MKEITAAKTIDILRIMVPRVCLRILWFSRAHSLCALPPSIEWVG